MKKLEDYTDDELKAELKRRQIERRQQTPRKKTEYVRFLGVVQYIDNKEGWKCGGVQKYKPFSKWKYRIKDMRPIECAVPKYFFEHSRDFCLDKIFNKNNAPKEGDTVALRVRKCKNFSYYSFTSAKIVEVINNN